VRAGFDGPLGRHNAIGRQRRTHRWAGQCLTYRGVALLRQGRRAAGANRVEVRRPNLRQGDQQQAVVVLQDAGDLRYTLAACIVE
jgi:hypothetical protein